MTAEQIKTMVLSAPEYEFLKTNPHLGGRVMLLTLGGSYGQGLNTENSDVDVRGCALNRPSDLLGLTTFEQVVNTETDTTIYAFQKLICLLLSCNPHAIEMLGCKPEHYLLLTEEGKLLLENRKLFLTKRAANAFGAYATQQLRKLENALARDRLPQARQEEHIRNAMESSLRSFTSQCPNIDHAGISLYTADSARDDLDREVYADIHLDKCPAREFKGLLNSLNDVLSSYATLGHRNHKKDELHLNKHAMHLIRLYLVCLDILEKGEIYTNREGDREMLLEIRHGKYMKEDGTYRQEFFDMVNEYEKRLQYARDNTSLPEEPDMAKVEELTMCINRKVVEEKA